MANRRDLVTALPAAGAAFAFGSLSNSRPALADATQGVVSWNRPSLVNNTVIGPNGAITSQMALEANARWGISMPPAVSEVAPGIYAMGGWALGQSMAIDAPAGWIVIDTGDSIRTSQERRAAFVPRQPARWRSAQPPPTRAAGT